MPIWKKPPPPIPNTKQRCTSVACSDTTSGHCGNPMCENFLQMCPIHGTI